MKFLLNLTKRNFPQLFSQKQSTRKKKKCGGSSKNINKQYKLYKDNRKKLDIQLLPYSYPSIQNKTVNIAIIIPYRERKEHLIHFLDHIYKLKKPANHHFDIYIIAQNNHLKFNRGILLNIGYYIAKHNFHYDRYIFHDVDSYPSQELFDLYFSFPERNIHFASPYLGYKYKFDEFFGGIIGVTSHDFDKINGFPSTLFGWGGEDDCFYNRFVINAISVYRPSIGSYILDPHDPPSSASLNSHKKHNILNDLKNWKNDGIKQITKQNIYLYPQDLDVFLQDDQIVELPDDKLKLSQFDSSSFSHTKGKNNIFIYVVEFSL
jgi:hypothetical protein